MHTGCSHYDHVVIERTTSTYIFIYQQNALISCELFHKTLVNNNYDLVFPSHFNGQIMLSLYYP